MMAVHQPTKTATVSESIWSIIPEATFRTHVVELERATNAVPVDVQTFDPSDWLPTEASAPESYRLSIDAEQRLANDISYIVAVGEGAQSVAATTIQECRTRSGLGLKVTVASVDAIEAPAQEFLNSVFGALSLTTEDSKSRTVDIIFELIVYQHRQRLLNRLRSSKWCKPVYLSRTHKKPLHADFTNLLHRAQFIYLKRERSLQREVESLLKSFSSLLRSFEELSTGTSEEHVALVGIVRASFALCTSQPVADYLRRLEGVSKTAQIQACLKTLHQLEKIAACYRIPLSMADLAVEHPKLFDNLKLVFLLPYDSIPIENAYQPWAKSTHVHAEVNLIVHHDLTFADTKSLWLQPRCLGTSKYLCYLCYLFVRNHGQFFPSNTHGACYDQWTIPDLAAYSDEIRTRYREVIRKTDLDIQSAMLGAVWRTEPMTSRENLIATSKNLDDT
jgi:hypothetical protein